MRSSNDRSRRGVAWAIIGGGGLLVGILAIVIVSLSSRTPESAPTEPAPPAASPTAQPTGSSAVDVVDSSVTTKGWVPEPATTDPDTYIRAAFAAASTFDTQLSTRPEWLSYLDTWFTPDTRYTSEADRQSDMQASQLELRQSVVLPAQEWDSLANEDGRVAAAVTGGIEYTDVPDDNTGSMRIGTADVVLTYTRTDGSGGETSYDDLVRVSVQVLCGEGSTPTPDTAQQSGDCKVVRFFSGTIEP